MEAGAWPLILPPPPTPTPETCLQRVDDWRYTCWFEFDTTTITVKTGNIIGRELYDHTGDPGELDWAGEHVNVVSDKANSNVVAALHVKILSYIQLK